MDKLEFLQNELKRLRKNRDEILLEMGESRVTTDGRNVIEKYPNGLLEGLEKKHGSNPVLEPELVENILINANSQCEGNTEQPLNWILKTLPHNRQKK